MRKIVLASAKGGVSKTATATAMAVGMARRGLRVLLADLDAQANATWVLTGGQGAEEPTLGAVLMRDATATEAIRPSTVEGLDLLPADGSLSGVNVALVQELGRDTRLRSVLAPIEGSYDVVLLDTAPTFTTILANALVYAEEVIVPVDPGMFAMLGLVQMQQTIEEVREAYGNHALRLAGLVLARVSRNNVCRDVEAQLRSRFGELVYRSTIPLNAKVEEAFTRGQTVLQYAPKSAGAMAYEALISEVMGDGNGETERGGDGAERGSRASDAA